MIDVKSRNGLIDTDGTSTGIAINGKFFAVIAITLILYLIPAIINPLSAYGPTTSKALGFLVAAVFFMVFSNVPLAVIAMLVAAFGTMIGLFDWTAVSTKLGTSAFYSAFGMMVVAMGCEFSNFGLRFGYIVLKRFGQKPVGLIIAVTITSALLSTVISNVAILVLMSSITNSILLSMGEKPGESKVGKAAMLCIVMGAMAGGMGLFCGSPIGNAAVLSYMTAALGGTDYSPTFAQWAAIAFPTLMLCIVPMTMVYIKYFKVGNNGFSGLPKSYYDDKLSQLGPMSGAEVRWLIILAAMIGAMSLGMKTAYAAMFFAAVSMFPIVGVSDCRQVLKRIPWNPLIAICILPLMSVVIVKTGMSDWLCDVIAPIFGNVGPFAFSLICSISLALLMNLLVNSMQAAMALVMSVAAPICVALGYNPTIILLPTAMASSYMWVLGANQYVMMNKEYGWWEMKDPMIPGFFSTLIPAVLAPVIACSVGPLIGLPLYV